MKKVAVALVAVTALALTTRLYAAGGVAGSPHDFSISTNTHNGVSFGAWNTRQGLCSPCHAAHHTDEQQLVPLWVHATTAGPFTPYDSPTMQATVGQPDKESLACLSCHDGTVALNQSISGLTWSNSTAQAVYISADAQIGPDLHTTHPISFTYNTALATTDGGLEDPSIYKIGDPKTALTIQTAPVPATWSGTSLTGKTIDEAMLFNSKMQCSSCHDVHRQEGSSPTSGILVRLSGKDSGGRGSLLCRTCHIK